MKLSDLKTLQHLTLPNAIRKAGLNVNTMLSRIKRGSPELTPEEQAKLEGVIKGTISELSKIVYTNTAINKLKERSKG